MHSCCCRFTSFLKLFDFFCVWFLGANRTLQCTLSIHPTVYLLVRPSLCPLDWFAQPQLLLYSKINPIFNARYVSTLTTLNWSSLRRPSKATALMLRQMILLSRRLKTLVGKVSFINTKMLHICVKIRKDFVLQFIFPNLCMDIYVYMYIFQLSETAEQ